jgi:hypothetical protein
MQAQKGSKWTQTGSTEMESMPDKVSQGKRTKSAQNRTMHAQRKLNLKYS